MFVVAIEGEFSLVDSPESLALRLWEWTVQLRARFLHFLQKALQHVESYNKGVAGRALQVLMMIKCTRSSPIFDLHRDRKLRKGMEMRL